jgi:hypothetical protein
MKRIPILLLLIPLMLPCCVAGEEMPALESLKRFRFVVKAPDLPGSLVFRLVNSTELKLQQSGFVLDDKAEIELRLKILSADFTSQSNTSLGKHGTVQFTIHEPVTLARPAATKMTACTWAGHISLFFTPEESLDERVTRSVTSLLDAFLNEWFKAKTKSDTNTALPKPPAQAQP